MIASEASANGDGLCVTNGAQIFVNGERHAPVVTSTLDDGTWRASANEWGNLTLCGDHFIGFDGTTNSGGFPNNTLTRVHPIKQIWKDSLKQQEPTK